MQFSKKYQPIFTKKSQIAQAARRWGTVPDIGGVKIFLHSFVPRLVLVTIIGVFCPLAGLSL